MTGKKKIKANLNSLKADTCYTRQTKNRKLSESTRGQYAIDAIGEIYHGIELFGFTKGQFSMIEVLEHILLQTGPADVSIITWSAADADVRKAFEFLDNGNIRKIRFLVDYSFKSRKPEILAKIVSKFGSEAVRVSSVHAKSILIQNEKWNIVVRTSMNLNFNPRFENFEISEDQGFAEFMRGIFESIWSDRNAAECLEANPAKDKAAFNRFGGSVITSESGEKTEVKSDYEIFGL
jgi:hypothetical protein